MFCMRGIERDFFIFYFWVAIVIGSALMAFISRIFFYIFFPSRAGEPSKMLQLYLISLSPSLTHILHIICMEFLCCKKRKRNEKNNICYYMSKLSIFNVKVDIMKFIIIR